MNNKEYADKTSMKTVMNDFLDSYARRDRILEFSHWLNKKLQQEMPDMTRECAEKLAGEIIEAVAAHGRSLCRYANGCCRPKTSAD